MIHSYIGDVTTLDQSNRLYLADGEDAVFSPLLRSTKEYFDIHGAADGSTGEPSVHMISYCGRTPAEIIKIIGDLKETYDEKIPQGLRNFVGQFAQTYTLTLGASLVTKSYLSFGEIIYRYPITTIEKNAISALTGLFGATTRTLIHYGLNRADCEGGQMFPDTGRVPTMPEGEEAAVVDPEEGAGVGLDSGMGGQPSTTAARTDGAALGATAPQLSEEGDLVEEMFKREGEDIESGGESSSPRSPSPSPIIVNVVTPARVSPPHSSSLSLATRVSLGLNGGPRISSLSKTDSLQNRE